MDISSVISQGLSLLSQGRSMLSQAKSALADGTAVLQPGQTIEGLKAQLEREEQETATAIAGVRDAIADYRAGG